MIFMNYLTNYLRWSRSRAKVTAPAPAEYPGSGRLRLRLGNPGIGPRNTFQCLECRKEIKYNIKYLWGKENLEFDNFN